MKKMTKKEFENETLKVIEELNDEQLVNVRKGIATLYKELKKRNCIQSGSKNVLAAFLLNIGCWATTVELDRMTERAYKD